ncbi:DUF5701 family protein [Terrabacter sp. GCM10028922]|uniref:DUF5701 family protein n=1 Tax=Terrabacter sp. GCM10028922 TaxID=3273428 RepID=UPI00361803C4
MREKAAGLPGPIRERAPFVLVMASLPSSLAITTQRHGSRSGFLSGDTSEIDEFRPIDGLDTPDGLYAAVDVRRGEEHLGRTPDKSAPKLGFCWAGNRHTWLGIASCAARVGA